MTEQTSFLRRLQRLGTEDRGWIMQQLSSSERARLVTALTSGEPGEPLPQVATQPVDEPDEPMKTVSRIEPRRLVQVLEGEPAWVIAALISSQSDAWGKCLCEALPASTRADVEHVLIRRLAYGASLVESVARLVVARCPAAEVPSSSAFDRLVDHLSIGRSKRRSVIHP